MGYFIQDKYVFFYYFFYIGKLKFVMVELVEQEEWGSRNKYMIRLDDDVRFFLECYIGV